MEEKECEPVPGSRDNFEHVFEGLVECLLRSIKGRYFQFRRLFVSGRVQPGADRRRVRDCRRPFVPTSKAFAN